MRKLKIFSFLLVFLLAIYTHGQEKKFVPEWNVGIGFGPTFSSVDFYKPRVDTKSFQQFFGGISLRYISEKNLGVIGELNYGQNGWEQKFKDQPSFSASHQLNYIDIPVMTHIYFGNKVRFFINLGPRVSFLVSENEKLSPSLREYISGGDAAPQTVTHQYFRMAEKKFDYGLVVGTGLEFRSPIGNFSLDGRYNFSLGNVYNNTKVDYFSRSANRVVSVRLTYYTKFF